MYQVVIGNKAKKTLKRLPATVYIRIIEALQKLTQQPRPRGCIKLEGRDNAWRIRIGDYRIIYEIDDGKLIVWVLDILRRDKAYKKK